MWGRTKIDLPKAPVAKSDAEWRAQLTRSEYAVLRRAKTEMPHTGRYIDNHEVGIYRCRACSAELFRSEHKFDSRCGWPSFFSPLAGDRVIERTEQGLFSARTEVLCASCHSHLGHVFAGERHDTPTDLRYCINSISLTFEAE
ncbi:MAG: peptide-methionine (R)-S-oxide reductase MsrB [Actinomycetota bacterium]|nr:peptide-methionine (R)-S-oxide reductase MsrB [Actinomycetota bacterium]